MKSFHITPIHPGEVLKDELDELNLSQTDLAKHISVLPKTINEICRGKRGLSASMALKLSRALGASPQFWLNLQNNWELSQIDEADYETIEQIAA
ncbi:MAG: addiction module antidote protein, HigA family [Phormidesmis priestleyi]|uniref:Addiction module antidote protein, HigA family n=1 Tax=Phormidesmis priestleyi TaxID=268141 RepID=A0A2W4XT28_9CYAN|nr:MAG: addiction module antidote protein, HigA family [Phormidesmis priestleyi]